MTMAFQQGQHANAEFYSYSGTGGSPVTTVSSYVSFDSFISSQGHDTRWLGKVPTGGDFALAKYERLSTSLRVSAWKKPIIGWLGGNFGVSGIQMSGSPSGAGMLSAVNALINASLSGGAAAINLSNPVRPHVDMVTAVADSLADGIPSMVGHTAWREQTLALKNAGDEYLNGTFGWLPLVSDIRKFAKTVKTSNDLIAQYERGSGKRQRRSWIYPQKSSADTIVNRLQGPFPAADTIFVPTPQWAITNSYSQIWFNGAFRYHVAPSGLRRYSDLASKLYGIDLTPRALWELAPWSWAADWFGNVGDVIANVSQLGPDASVMEWGYMMNESVKETKISHTLTGRPVTTAQGHIDTANKNFPMSAMERTSYKTRVTAQPYRFSASLVPLSVRQKATVIAVGLSRLAK
jgi:hypothetical protein